MKKVSYVPDLEYKLLSASMASKTSGMAATLRPNEAILGAGDSAYKFQGETGMYATAVDRVLSAALRSTGSPGQDTI